MSRTEFNDLAGKFGKGVAPGMSTGMKILAAVGAAGYGVTQSLYTVDGDHRAHIPSYMIPISSKNFQMINISLGVMSRSDSLRLPALHRNLGSGKGVVLK